MEIILKEDIVNLGYKMCIRDRYNNGIDLPFHYEVLDKEGRSVYR